MCCVEVVAVGISFFFNRDKQKLISSALSRRRKRAFRFWFRKGVKPPRTHLLLAPLSAVGDLCEKGGTAGFVTFECCCLIRTGELRRCHGVVGGWK